MKSIILLLGLFICSNLYSQVKYNLENSVTGLYTTTKTGNQLSLSFMGNNSIENKKISFDLSPSYSLQYSPQLSQNELMIRENLKYGNSKRDLFITHTYNYSMIRGIDADNFIGFGCGLKFNPDSNIIISTSYAILYHNTNYNDGSNRERIRNSIRVKAKIVTKLTHISFEYYYQPSFIDFSDYIVIGNTKFTFFPKSKVNLILQDFINYRSDDPNFKSIHNFTLGIGMKISN